MSVVIAIKEGDTFYFGADTQGTLGESKRPLTTPSTQKIWAVKDTPNCIMGGVGLMRDLNLIRYLAGPVVPELNLLKNDFDIGTIIETGVPNIFGVMQEYSKIVDGGDADTNAPAYSCFMWAYKDRCFTIFNDGLVAEVEDYEAIGSGADAALASLKHSEGLPVETRMLMALEAAAGINLYVSEPYVMIDTKETQLFMIGVSDEDAEEEEQDADEAPTVAVEPVETAAEDNTDGK